LTNVGVEFAPSAEAQTGAAGAGTLSVPDSAANIVAGQGLRQSYSFVLVAVNHNIVRIAGGALGKLGKPKTGSCYMSYHSTHMEKQCNNGLFSACAA
jgi:hypothetical protein